MSIKLKKLIAAISVYSETKFQDYLDTTDLDTLHTIKLYADDLYYNTGESSGLTDDQFDLLKETVQKRDPIYVPSVGAVIRYAENRVDLPFWLGSMNKFKPEDKKEIARWISKNKTSEYIIEDKLDGVSCLAIFEHGNIKLYTRGNGLVGADISYLAPYFDTIPKNLDININIRGELIIPEAVFNDKYAQTYANARNMVAGITGAKKVRDGLTDVQFVAYEVVSTEELRSPAQQFEYLATMGFSVVRYKLVPQISVDILSKELLYFKETSIYTIDGIIVQSNVPYYRNLTGNPDYAFAFKMTLASNIKEVAVIKVVWGAGKFGQLTPVIHYNPVQILGTLNRKASGKNAKFIYDNEIGPGTIIKVSKGGEVIPDVVGIVKPAPDGPQMPTQPFYWDENHVQIFAIKIGPEHCIKLITYFFRSLGVKYLGEANVGHMYADGLDNILKIFGASEGRISAVPGIIAPKRIHTNIRSLHDLSMAKVLGVSGVFGINIGTRRIEVLLKAMPNILKDYKNIPQQQLYEAILMVEGLGAKITTEIVLNLKWAAQFIEALQEFVTFKTNNIARVNNDLAGMKIVFTGFRDSKLEENIVARGGQVSGGQVNSKTTLLVVAHKDGKTSTKVKKAQELGIKIVDKQELLREYIK